MHIACRVPKSANTHSEHVGLIRIAFTLQQQLHERASMLRYTYIACFLYICILLELLGDGAVEV